MHLQNKKKKKTSVLNEASVGLAVLVGTIIDWKESILMMKCENVNLMFARLSLCSLIHPSFPILLFFILVWLLAWI
jgi:hypothetical protein